MKLRDRLSITFLSVTSFALVTSFATVSFLVRRDELRELDTGLLSQALAAADAAEKKPQAADGLVEVPERLIPMKRYVAVFDHDGNVLSQTRSFSGTAPPLRELRLPRKPDDDGVSVDLKVDKEPLRGVVVPVDSGQGTALLYAVSRRPFDEDMTFLYRVFSALFLASTIVTALAARVLGTRLASDVDAIAEVARVVASGDLRTRVRGAARGSTETRALGEDLDHMITQLDQLMQAQRTFVSYAAHELRSPLATLRGELQLALRRPRDAEEYREAIREVLEEVEGLADLAEDLLALARVQRAEAMTAQTNLSDALADAVRMMRGPADAARVEIRTPSDDEVARVVRGPRADIARALRNLVENAVGHSQSGDVVEVAIAVEPADSRVRVSVSDHGPGVPENDRPHIFAPFYRGQVEQAGERGGAGLGLAITREIARSSGGDLYLDESYTGGARFVLDLPLVAALPAPSARAGPRTTARDEPPGAGFGGRFGGAAPFSAAASGPRPCARDRASGP